MSNNNIEEWCYTIWHDPRYQVSNFGRIKGPHGRLLKTGKNKDGYCGFIMCYKEGNYRKQKYEQVNRIIIFYHYVDQEKMPDYFFDKRYDVDHIDRNRGNNHISNLRFLTKGENNHNRDAKGYSWHKRNNKFLAQIMVHGKKISLGYFSKETDARRAYEEASIKYYGNVKFTTPTKIKPTIIKKVQ